MATRDDTYERTIEPTRLHLAEARERGVVARSSDLAGALALLGAVGAAALFLPGIVLGLKQMVETMLTGAGNGLSSPAASGTLLWTSAASALWSAAMLAVSLMAVAVLANVLQVALRASPERIRADWARVSPGAGWSKLVSTRSAMRGLMAGAKLTAVAAVAFVTIRSGIRQIVATAGCTAGQLLGELGSLATDLALRIGAALLVIAVVDYLYQRWQHRQDLKMTRRELLDELKRGGSARPAIPRRGGAEVQEPAPTIRRIDG